LAQAIRQSELMATQSNQTPFDGREFAKTLTTGPGVYVMKDQVGRVLYVGKAKNLKRRVASYFNGQDKGGRINLMIRKIAAIEVSLTRTETEALLLENEWIKAHKPRFNISLRDDRSYPWIRLSVEHAYPLISFYRGKVQAKSEFFGPYASIGAVRESLKQIYRLFRLRQCRDSVFSNRTRPCLQYQIKRCSAPCVGYISQTDYAQDVDAARQLLRGNDDGVIQYLIQRMSHASERLDYEQAAVYRDHIQSLQTVRSQQYVIGHQQDLDVIGLSRQADAVALHVVSFRNGRNVGGRTLFPANIEADHTDAEVMDAFLGQFYQDHSPPKTLIMSVEPSSVGLWQRALAERRGGGVDIKWQVRSEKRRWLLMAQDNATDALRRRLAEKDQWGQALDALTELLGLEAAPERMECFDVSHSQGQQTTASCVVFGPYGPSKRHYRLYGIDGIQKGDDYAAIEQTLTRRYQRALKEDQPLPDLILIDGGLGQLRRAEQVLADLGLDAIPIVGVAKGAARRSGHERIIRGDREVVPGPHHKASHAIQRIRDEAHRFALAGHRRRRQVAAHHSILDEVDGIGPTKRQRLLEQFGGLNGLMSASVDDLQRVEGISRPLAERIHQTLQGMAGTVRGGQ
jgi:excinuclease ABC subunit C